jgi:hypothetical protein
MPRFRPALLVAVLTALAGASAARAAPAPVPCSAVGAGKYACGWYVPGDGIHGGARVMLGAVTVGFLHQGTNWVVCQQRGATVRDAAGDLNHWYGWTEADNRRWGWASPLEARGGADFGPFAGVPDCRGAHGAAPGTGGLWGAAATPSRPAPPAAATPVATTRPAAPACLRTVEGQSLRIVGAVTEDAYVETYFSGGRPSHGQSEISRWGIGSIAVRAATCQTPSRRWRLINPVSVTPRYEGIDAAGKLRGSRGWGLAPRRLQRSALQIDAIRCDRGWLWSGAKAILGLPLPIPYLASVGQWLGGLVLPNDKTGCIRLTELRVGLDIGRRGRLSVRGDSGHYLRFTDYGNRMPNVKAVHDQLVTARQG